MLTALALALLADASIDPALLTVTDIDGVTHEVGHAEAVVVVFLKPGCPVANYYHPTLRRLHADWGEAVRLIPVHAGHAVTADEARTHRREYDVAGTVVVDPEQRLVRALDATTTPEAFVLTPDGRVRYRGRIDDVYVGFGQRRQQASDATLANAVAAVRAGREPTSPKTKPVGCRIRVAPLTD